MIAGGYDAQSIGIQYTAQSAHSVGVGSSRRAGSKSIGRTAANLQSKADQISQKSGRSNYSSKLQQFTGVEQKEAPPKNTPLGWNYLSKLLAIDHTKSLLEISKALVIVEQDIAQIDKYVEYCTKKYKPFSFNIKPLIKDE